jgi:peroxygenase
MPHGTTANGWAEKHAHQTVLQQHCDFFDQDRDGVISPKDTYVGFHRLGFGVILSIIAAFIIHINFSYPTSSSWLPDPLFRINLKNMHRTKHGGDTATYDNEGRFIPQKFEEIFHKYAGGRDYLTFWEGVEMLKGQRNVSDPIGWGGAIFECKRLGFGLCGNLLTCEQGELRGLCFGRRMVRCIRRTLGRRLMGVSFMLLLRGERTA